MNMPTQFSDPVISLPFTRYPNDAYFEPVNLERVYAKAD